MPSEFSNGLRSIGTAAEFSAAERSSRCAINISEVHKKKCQKEAMTFIQIDRTLDLILRLNEARANSLREGKKISLYSIRPA